MQCNCLLWKKCFKIKKTVLDVITLLLLAKHRNDTHDPCTSWRPMGRIRRFRLKSQFDKYNPASGPSSQRWCVHLCTYNLWKVSVAFAPCWLILWRQEFMLWWGRGGRQIKRTLQPRWWPALHKSVGHFMSHTPHHPRNAQALRLRPQVARADANDAVPKQLATSVRDKIW